MKSVNKIIMIGNLTRDPELVQINENTDVAKFTLAVNESYKKPNGEVVENTTFIDCEAWSGLAKIVSQYLKKGSRVYIEGSLRADTWMDADSGKNRTKHKIRIVEMMMLDGKRDGGSSDYSSNSDSSSSNSESKVKAVDEELPF
jgi:single-strand DNA-binding protein